MPKVIGRERIIALDTETTGVDFKHGAKPYFVTTCDSEGVNQFWEWDVNPINREPIIPYTDLLEIEAELEAADKLILQNAKFDMRALDTTSDEPWDWDRYMFPKVFETLYAAHLLNSFEQKSLTTLALIYLGVNVKPFEDEMEEACKECRRIVRRDYKDWRIAKEGLPEMPSAKTGSGRDEDRMWKFDAWLPRRIAQEQNLPDDHPYWRVCKDYANCDSATTVALYPVMIEQLEEQGLTPIFEERMKLLRIVYLMESEGIGASRERLAELREVYEETYNNCGRFCKELALKDYNYDLQLPKASMNNSLKTFLFDEEYLDLPILKTTKKGSPSFDKGAKEDYINTLEGKPKQFIEQFDLRGRIATSLSYMESYEKHMIDMPDGCTIFSSVNPVGTKTLRWSSYNPNQQQLSKRKLFKDDDRTVRYIFGPKADREWWSLDYDNLELRIPAYECQEPAMLKLFERPDDPPFYGSYHLLICSILHKEKWQECIDEAGLEGAGEEFKYRYKDTWYTWTKNGNFAELYGAIDRADGQGTADLAFHVPGAQSIIAKRLTKKSALNNQYIKYASEHGFVETMPDQSVNCDRGYPLQCSRNSWGGILQTVPLNYHVQGTACWIIMRAMIKVQEYFDLLNSRGFDARIIMNVHDEIVIDLPYKSDKGNLPKVERVKSLMESIGDDINVPLTCGMDYHPHNWSQAS